MNTLGSGGGFLSPEMYGGRVVVSPGVQSAGAGRKIVYFIEDVPRPPPGALVPRVALYLIIILWFGTIFASVAAFWLYLYPKDKGKKETTASAEVCRIVKNLQLPTEDTVSSSLDDQHSAVQQALEAATKQELDVPAWETYADTQ